MDDLTVKVRESGNIAVLDFKGRITIGEPASLLRDKIRETLDGGHRKILLNFADVSYVDSAGLGQLVGSFATAAHRGGEIKLVALGKRVQELLVITHLDSIFETFTTEVAAIHSFAQS